MRVACDVYCSPKWTNSLQHLLSSAFYSGKMLRPSFMIEAALHADSKTYHLQQSLLGLLVDLCTLCISEEGSGSSSIVYAPMR